MPLTDTAIRKAKPADKPIKHTDGGGLYLLLRPDGARWWRMDYRRPITGKRNTLSLGVYPDVGLADARAKRDEARKLLAAGTDPGEHRKAEKAAGMERAANSFEVVAREWFRVRCSDLAASYREKIIARLENDVFPWLGGMPVADVTAPDLLKTMRRIEERGTLETAHRVLQCCGRVFRYAIATGRATSDPTTALRGALAPAEGKHHAAITEPAAFGGLLRAISGYNGDFVTSCALKLAPLWFVRPGELRQAEWSEFDLEAGTWCIPASKMKMKEDHIVPLSEQALAVVRDLQPLTGGSRYLFPSARSNKRPMSNNTINAALRRMGYSNDTMTAHGFRAAARTMLDEQLGFRPDYIEHQLAHAVRDPNGRAYNRTAHLPERQKMMQAWADYLDTLKANTDGKVVPFKQRAA